MFPTTILGTPAASQFNRSRLDVQQYGPPNGRHMHPPPASLTKQRHYFGRHATDSSILDFLLHPTGHHGGGGSSGDSSQKSSRQHSNEDVRSAAGNSPSPRHQHHHHGKHHGHNHRKSHQDLSNRNEGATRHHRSGQHHANESWHEPEVQQHTNGNNRQPAYINDDIEFEYEDIVLEKGRTGLGFSIAGGQDNPHVENDPSIYVTKILDGGAAAIDGRLRKDDVILSVNSTNTVNVAHEIAVEALKHAGNNVRLYVRRIKVFTPTAAATTHHIPVTPSYHAAAAPQPVAVSRPPVHEPAPHAAVATPVPPGTFQRIELQKGPRGLGFSIAGGIGNEHIPGDTGIYVTKIIDGGAAQQDGRLTVGDKLISVGQVVLEGFTHEEAVQVLKATSERVVIQFIKCPHPPNFQDSSSFDHGASEVGTPAYIPPPQPVVVASRPSEQRYGSNTYDRTPSEHAYQPPVVAPPAPPEPSNDVGRQPRYMVLKKGATGLGFNIVGGEDNEGIFISHVAPGGVADLSGQLLKGDQLLEVNETNLRSATHEQAAHALKTSGANVQIVAQYKPDEFSQFQQKIEDIRKDMLHGGGDTLNRSYGNLAPQFKREFYVRSLFDFDPTRDNGLPSRGLAFNYGDILHVVNASDDDWWQAERVLPDGRSEGYGIVPSKRRVEKRERARRKQVNWGHENDAPSGLGSRSGSMSEKVGGGKKSLSFSRKFPFMKSKERLNDESDFDRASTSITTTTVQLTSESALSSDWPDDPILSYEVVEQQELRYVRPVIVLGPLKDRMNDDLISELPDRFGSCVPHTTREPREHEANTRDYHFVPSRDLMERDIQNHLFIEAGQYNGNLYGTSIQSVRDVADQGKHCILDVSGNAIKRLQNANLFPIAVFIKPRDIDQLREWNRRMNEEEAMKQFSRAQMIEQEFSEYFTAIVHGDTPEDIYYRIKEIIREQSKPLVWVPAKEQLN